MPAHAKAASSRLAICEPRPTVEWKTAFFRLYSRLFLLIVESLIRRCKMLSVCAIPRAESAYATRSCVSCCSVAFCIFYAVIDRPVGVEKKTRCKSGSRCLSERLGIRFSSKFRLCPLLSFRNHINISIALKRWLVPEPLPCLL